MLPDEDEQWDVQRSMFLSHVHGDRLVTLTNFMFLPVCKPWSL